jgi:DNA-binding YbaB/EbfC family protein
VFNHLGTIAELMRNAGKLRDSLQSMGQLEVEGTSGGGVVTARVNGRMELVSLRIDPKLVADGDAELIEDLVAAAVNAALQKSRDAAAKSFASLAGGLPLNLFPDAGGPARPKGGEGP